MTGRATDRKGKNKETKSISNELDENLATFTLPDSLPCSEVDFPVLIHTRTKANWKEILEENEKNLKELEEYTASKMDPVPRPKFLKTECDYVKRDIFVHLIPALEETLNKAIIWEALKIQKCFFNGIDHIAQVLWNNNPRYPSRKLMDLHLFNMPWVRDHLKINFFENLFYINLVIEQTNECAKFGFDRLRGCIAINGPRSARVRESELRSLPSAHSLRSIKLRPFKRNHSRPRPYYPKSWLWPEDYAATLIQKSVRQYFVQREEEVQEMRDFWRKVEAEDNLPEMDTNPYLAKKFASLQTFHKKT